MITREEFEYKALEILKEYSNIDFGCDMSENNKRITEAIKELEALQQHIKSLEAQLANTEQLTCEYKEDHDVYLGTVYDFSCGYLYVTVEGDLKENGVKYCPSCGGKITPKDTQ